MMGRLILALVVGVAVFLCLDRQNEEIKEGFLSEAEMRGLMGGHGGASCDSCQNAGERLDECAHFNNVDPCQSDKCIVNWLIEDSCQAATQSNCWATLNPDLDYLIQELRSAENCETDNPSTWKLWRIHYFGPSCKTRNYEKRCEMDGIGCFGTTLETSTRSVAIDCI